MGRRVELSAEDQARISAAVHAAEAQTSGEIVTILAERSDDYADTALWWSAGVALLALGFLCVLPDFYLGLIDWLLGRWAIDWTPRAVLELALTAASLKFAGMWLLQLWRPLRLALVPGPVRSARVRARALACFRAAAERRTKGRTGILLYLSLDEHRAEIIADEAIHNRVAADEWGKAMADLIAPVREGRVADGLVAAIGDIGTLLSAHLPRAADDENELPDRVITL
ncbi:MAG: TPM domain-containing protein [Chakrabartia sp.]